MNERVELHEAFFWDCPECGREQFQRTICAEMTLEERAELGSDQIILVPESVQCRYCGREFETIAPFEPSSEEI